MVEIERAHEQLGSLSFFLGKTLNPFAKATEFVSELVKHTIEDCYGTISQVSLADADFCDQSACAHHRRTLEKENKCGNNNLLCNAWFTVLFSVTVVVK